MDLFVAILLCLFFAVLIAVSQIYLEMDKQKTRAGIYIGKMKQYLDEWVKCTVELACTRGLDPKTADRLRMLADSYFSSHKYGDTFAKISLVNSIAALSGALTDISVPGAETDSLLLGRADAASSLRLLRTEYNKGVGKLNGRLDKRIPAAVGRLFRVRRLEELSDLL